MADHAEGSKRQPVAAVEAGRKRADAVAPLDDHREHERAQHHAQRVEPELGNFAQCRLDDG